MIIPFFNNDNIDFKTNFERVVYFISMYFKLRRTECSKYYSKC